MTIGKLCRNILHARASSLVNQQKIRRESPALSPLGPSIYIYMYIYIYIYMYLYINIYIYIHTWIWEVDGKIGGFSAAMLTVRFFLKSEIWETSFNYQALTQVISLKDRGWVLTTTLPEINSWPLKIGGKGRRSGFLLILLAYFSESLHCPSLTWNLKIMVSKRNLPFKGAIFRWTMLNTGGGGNWGTLRIPFGKIGEPNREH